METESPKTPKKHVSYWMAIAYVFPITCLGSFFLLFLYTFGVFTTWKSLGAPPAGASGIISADIENVWVKTNDGEIYTLSRFCYQNPSCNKWLPVSDSKEIQPFEINPLKRGKVCKDLGSSFNPGNPFGGNVVECVLVPAYGYPDPEWGEELYYALMSDGSIRYWVHGNGILSMYGLVIIPFMLTVLSLFITSIIYLFIFITRKIKGRVKTTST